MNMYKKKIVSWKADSYSSHSPSLTLLHPRFLFFLFLLPHAISSLPNVPLSSPSPSPPCNSYYSTMVLSCTSHLPHKPTLCSCFLLLLLLLWAGRCILLASDQPHSSREDDGNGYHRKIGPPAKFDFGPFIRRMSMERLTERGDGVGRRGYGGDPLFGDEKRLVPSGPNPLHH